MVSRQKTLKYTKHLKNTDTIKRENSVQAGGVNNVMMQLVIY